MRIWTATMKFRSATITSFHDQDRSKPQHANPGRKARRARHDLRFVGVDGEGINIAAPGGPEHRYVMLSVGDRTLWQGGAELDHTTIFPFLYNEFRADPERVMVGFFLGYDFTLWLKSVTEHEARLLFTPLGRAVRARREGPNPVPFPVYVRGGAHEYGQYWEVDMLGFKRMRLRPHKHQVINNRCRTCHEQVRGDSYSNQLPWAYICDTGAFFQTSFVKMINPADWAAGEGPCTPDEYTIICAGKASRGDRIAPDDHSYYDDMVRYNRLENEILARAMTILNRGFCEVGVRLGRDKWYGPGAAIQEWLNGRVKDGAFLDHRQVASVLDESIIEAAQASYYGGRFEITHHGHIPGVTHEYDITSAYPHAMRTLPCLCSAVVDHGTGEVTEPASGRGITFVRGTFSQPADQVMLGGLPWRSDKGTICYPRTVTGWFLASEIRTAMTYGFIDYSTMIVEEWRTIRSTCDHEPPLTGLQDLFDRRLTIGKKTATGKAIKLLINSCYGKFAQSVGSPRYGNPVYAAAITSHTRSMIMQAIGTHPEHADGCVMIATDGVYFRRPHPGLDAEIDPTAPSILGAWEHDTKINLTVMKPGVYWDDHTRDQLDAGETPSLKSRGISAAALAANIGRLDQLFTGLFERNRSGVEVIREPMPDLRIAIAFGITSPMQALARGKWSTAGQVTWDAERLESGNSLTKRTLAVVAGDVIVSCSRAVSNPVTAPYERRFGFNDEDNPDPIIGFDQEGPLTSAVSEIIHEL